MTKTSPPPILAVINRVYAKAEQFQTQEATAKYALSELTVIRGLVQQDWPLPDEIKGRIKIGPFAAKNIADWNPGLADSLINLDYALRHDLDGIDNLPKENLQVPASSLSL